MKWREWRGKYCRLEVTSSELEFVGYLAEYMRYYCARRRNRETTIAGKLVAGNFFHGQ